MTAAAPAAHATPAVAPARRGLLPWATDIVRRIRRRMWKMRMRSALGGHRVCFVASNCVGSRLASMADLPYNSPTVDLYITPDDFLAFASRFEAYRGLRFVADPEESANYDFPVVTIGGGEAPVIRLYLMHYHSIEEAQAVWDRRFARLKAEDVALVMTDKLGATEEHLRAFDALPYPKIVFTHRPHDDIESACYVPGYEDEGEVGDLFSEWHALLTPLTNARLRRMFAPWK